MSTEQYAKLLVLIVRVVLISGVVFIFGVVMGRQQAKEWDTIKIHRSLQLEGYNYCPYCGEEIKEDEE